MDINHERLCHVAKDMIYTISTRDETNKVVEVLIKDKGFGIGFSSDVLQDNIQFGSLSIFQLMAILDAIYKVTLNQRANMSRYFILVGINS